MMIEKLFNRKSFFLLIPMMSLLCVLAISGIYGSAQSHEGHTRQGINSWLLFAYDSATDMNATPTMGTNSAAQAQVGFTNASLQGTYSLSQIFGDNTAGSLGFLTFDGNGNFTITQTATNIPGPPDENGLGTRVVIPQFSAAGTYSVNPDGSGRFLTIGNGFEIINDTMIIHANRSRL